MALGPSPEGDSIRPYSTDAVLVVSALPSGNRLRESGWMSSGWVNGSGSDCRQPAGIRWLNPVSSAPTMA